MPLPECTRLDDSHPFGPGPGWRRVEVLETFGGDMSFIGPVKSEEIVDLVRIAVASYTEDRLHKDPEVPKALADASKAKWVVDACNDPERNVVVYRKNGTPIAFLSLAGKSGAYRIDLLAVDEAYRGNGIAKALIFYALGSLNIKSLAAGTQSTNESAKNLYQSFGMDVIKRERTYHR